GRDQASQDRRARNAAARQCGRAGAVIGRAAKAGHGLSDTTADSDQTAGPFSRFEWMMAGRYLRARRKEAFISVIGWLTLIGVAIGVATLIVVMSVMNGFRAELLIKILGLNGHFTAYPIDAKFTDYD